MDMQTHALIFALGGLAVAVVAAAAGLRLLRTKAVFEYKLALMDKELPWAASLYFVYGARTLHLSAGTFCAFALADLAQANNAWTMGASITLGVLAVVGLGVCSMAMVSLAAIDFKVGISKFSTRAIQMLVGFAGLGVTLTGLIVLIHQGYFWPPK
jgi:hypothetical protein